MWEDLHAVFKRSNWASSTQMGFNTWLSLESVNPICKLKHQSWRIMVPHASRASRNLDPTSVVLVFSKQACLTLHVRKLKNAIAVYPVGALIACFGGVSVAASLAANLLGSSHSRRRLQRQLPLADFSRHCRRWHKPMRQFAAMSVTAPWNQPHVIAENYQLWVRDCCALRLDKGVRTNRRLLAARLGKSTLSGICDILWR